MCFYYDEGETVEFAASSIHKAIKPHSCHCCPDKINRGEEYLRESGKYDGSFYTTCTCRRCCYDMARIVADELDRGCRWDESWPRPDDIDQMVHDGEFTRTPASDVPAEFNLKTEWPYVAVQKLRKTETASVPQS